MIVHKPLPPRREQYRNGWWCAQASGSYVPSGGAGYFEFNMNDRPLRKVVDLPGRSFPVMTIRLPCATHYAPYPVLSALAWFVIPSGGEAIRVARLLQPVNEGGIIAWREIFMSQRRAAVLPLSGGPTAVPDSGAAGVADPGVGWLVITPDPAPHASTFVINGTPRTGSVNAAAGTAAMVGNTLVNRGV